MLKIVTALRAPTKIGKARRTVAGLAAPIVPGASAFDVQSMGALRWPALELLAGTAVLGMSLLWFRRSKRPPAEDASKTESSVPTEAETAAPLARPQAPPRIRGLLLLNLKPADGAEHIESAPPLGPRDKVIRAMQAAVPGLSVDEAGRGVFSNDDSRITLDLGSHDPVHAVVASAEGDTGIDLLRTLVQTQGWRAYAARAGVFIEPDALELFALPDALPSARP